MLTGDGLPGHILGHSISEPISPLRARASFALSDVLVRPLTKRKKLQLLGKATAQDDAGCLALGDSTSDLGDGEPDTACEPDRRTVGTNELFFDLIFVAALIKLGRFVAFDLTWDTIGETGLLFITFWLSWFHANMLMTRCDVFAGVSFRRGGPCY